MSNGLIIQVTADRKYPLDPLLRTKADPEPMIKPITFNLLFVLSNVARAQPAGGSDHVHCSQRTVVEAGPDLSACIDPPGITLSGSVIGATSSGVWSTTGDGDFNRNAIERNAVYRPGPKDIAARSVVLYLTSTNNGNCAAETDSLTIRFMPLPEVEAGTISRISDGMIALNGRISDGAIAQWSTTAEGEFLLDGGSVETSFRFDPERSDRTAMFVLQARNGCGISTDTIEVRAH